MPEQAREILRQQAILMLPGTMFQPESHTEGRRQFRIAFANVDAAGIGEMFRRLAQFRG